jgi:hypothetical protein
MRLLRGLLGALLWIVGGLLGLVGFVLCVTVILLPVGIPLLLVARRLLTRAVQLLLPRALAHPVDEMTKAAKKTGREAKAVTSGAGSDISKKARQVRKRVA